MLFLQRPLSHVSALATQVSSHTNKVGRFAHLSSSACDNHPGILRPRDLQNVVIACINGRGGATGSGMVGLRDTLRVGLEPMGVIPDNIFHRSWNHNQDDDPTAAPWVTDLNREIESRSPTPSYIGLIGHSYGGWAACRVSRVTSRIPDFIGLVDPVFGLSNSVQEGDYPRGAFIKNWFQKNGIIGGDQCIGAGRVPCSGIGGGLACGYQNVEGAEPMEMDFDKDWDGNRNRIKCVGGRIHKQLYHTDMDDCRFIWRLIYDRIVEDLNRLKYINLSVFDNSIRVVDRLK